MRFEFDPKKSRINERKHGIDFEQAQLLCLDTKARTFNLAYEPESRYLRIAKLTEDSTEICSAIFTLRGESIRLISVRRARKKEKATYEESIRENG